MLRQYSSNEVWYFGYIKTLLYLKFLSNSKSYLNYTHVLKHANSLTNIKLNFLDQLKALWKSAWGDDLCQMREKENKQISRVNITFLM